MNDLPTDRALHWLLASRRDALLLVAIGVGLAAWVWERGALAALGGSAVAAGLFVLALALVRQGQAAQRLLWAGASEAERVPWLSFGAGGWPLGLALLAALPATLLVGRAAWLGLNSRGLALLVAALAAGWQVWLYFWTAGPPITQEGQHGRVE